MLSGKILLAHSKVQNHKNKNGGIIKSFLWLPELQLPLCGLPKFHEF